MFIHLRQARISILSITSTIFLFPTIDHYFLFNCKMRPLFLLWCTRCVFYCDEKNDLYKFHYLIYDIIFMNTIFDAFYKAFFRIVKLVFIMQSVNNMKFSRVENQTRPTAIWNETIKERLVLDLLHCQKKTKFMSTTCRKIYLPSCLRQENFNIIRPI